jgi:predicted ATPase/anti-anti-sigma regulatory factor
MVACQGISRATPCPERTLMMEIPGYTLEVLVHEGAETSLHRGVRLSDGARVAVKVTRDDYPTWRALSRLRREHAILSELDLPGVPRALALVPHGRGLSLVMEDLGPFSLHDVIAERGRLDAESALGIVIPLAQTLGALHRRRIVHKDVKPRNVMIDEATLAPHLVDFGIAARLAQETAEAAPPEALEGTLAYLAPEQTGRMNRPVDRRSDLYALGITLYEMLTGTTPFPAEDAAAAIHAHLVRVPVPPHERTPGVPRALSEVVLKLIAKAPEDRYQSAEGLVADLEVCRARVAATGTAEPFPLGTADQVEEILLPARPIGREPELSALAAALDRASTGAATLGLLTGPSGIGKSALVHELIARRAPLGAMFAEGKFDPMARGAPFTALLQAIRMLVRQALAEPLARLEQRRRAIEAALGQSARVMTDLCPELSLLVGPQPEPPTLGPSEAKNRFALLLGRLLGVFGREGAPLVLFLDDLQWADPASLDLLGRILGDPEAHHLLLIGAYRSEEVDAAHPLTGAISALRKAGVTPTHIELLPLSLPAATSFVAEALSAEAPRVAELAAVAHEKTQGNPLFLGQFLRALAEDGALLFDHEARAFTWDLARVRAAMATDNVLSLMARKVEQLAPATRRALVLASCVGPSFDLGLLAALLERSPSKVAADLWEALREGLILPVSGDYRLLDAAAEAPATVEVAYRFVHDRVQEACYARLPEGERPAAHLAIGRALLARAGEAPTDDEVVEATRHLNLGATKITDPEERQRAARLDLRAGRRAMAATAFEAAAGLFAAGRALAGKEGFARDHATSFALLFEGAEAESLAGAFEVAEALAEEALARAKGPVERARVHGLRVRALATRGKFQDSVRAGLAGLSELGVSLPEDAGAQGAALGEALGAVDRLIDGRPIESLAAEGAALDPAEQVVRSLLSDLAVPVYYVSPTLYGLVIVEQVRRSLSRGQSELSAFAFMAFGFMRGAAMGKPAEGHAFGRLALALCERYPSPAIVARVCTMFSNLIYVREPLRAAFAQAERGRAAAIEAGDNVYLAAGCYGFLPLLIGAGVPLEEASAEGDRGAALVLRTKDVMATVMVQLSRQLIACLRGKTRGKTSFDSDDVAMDVELGRLDEKEHAIPFYYVHAYRLFLHVLHGEHEAALSEAEEAEKRSLAVMGLYWTANVAFLEALARIGLARGATAEEARRAHVEAARPRRDRLEALAGDAPSNFRHKVALIDAELASLEGARFEVIGLYERAIELARENGYAQDEALANELCGRFLLRCGHERAARGYLVDALRGYGYWGATAKVEALAAEMPEVASLRATGAGTSTSTATHTNHSGGTTMLQRVSVGSLRDAALLLRAAQTIAGEIVLSKVVARLMRIVLENSGAERGALLLARDEHLFLEATFTASPETIEVAQRRPLEEEQDLAQQAVLYAFRTREALVLDDAPGDLRFAADPYLAAKRTRSILCLPVSQKGRTAGILYLENGASAGAFTAVRVELLGLLASQAAIAIENALLVEAIQAANEEAARANERLEAEVRARTAALERSHEARIAELSAPLLPIAEGILVMPIIGTVDAARAAQVMDVALAGAQQAGARVVILDVTGMRNVDASVVEALVGVASALRLLGAEPMITGIRAEVARTMVDLDTGLAGLTTLATLRAGIARAMQTNARKVR